MDCARVYGNEALVGEALAAWIERHGRDAVFVTSKIWNDAHQPAAARSAPSEALSHPSAAVTGTFIVPWTP